ncbi:CLUMA_CG017745, isoform A [Clunio marinus]|uniref:CLUMA_CG017745, isoform A n=1 Tax=Clunio marinus TaxID=568069 RepID=A0A1J1J1F0_9DIPT|nr:CLUMA_CG017745, isoform A [Clunio marinus]
MTAHSRMAYELKLRRWEKKFILMADQDVNEIHQKEEEIGEKKHFYKIVQLMPSIDVHHNSSTSSLIQRLLCPTTFQESREEQKRELCSQSLHVYLQPKRFAFQNVVVKLHPTSTETI